MSVTGTTGVKEKKQHGERNITNVKFNKLLALERYTVDMSGSCVWLCRCDCGKMTKVRASYLRYGKTKSCGCLKLMTNSAAARKALKIRWDRYYKEHPEKLAARLAKEAERQNKPIKRRIKQNEF